MSHETYELTAEARERVGKGSARELRRNGKVPAVIYGEKQPPVAIAPSYKAVYYKIHRGAFMTTVATIHVDCQTARALPKAYKPDPGRASPRPVDSLPVGRNTIVTVNIPVQCLNEEKSVGLKRGGVLNIVRHEIEATCPADRIPDAIEVDLAGTDLGDAIHISAVTLPDGVTPTI